MSVDQSSAHSTITTPPRWRHQARFGPLAIRLRNTLFIVFTLLLTGFCSGSAAIPAEEARQRGMAMVVAPWQFDLVTWEIEAIGHKLRAWFGQPAAGLASPAAIAQVNAYLDRAAAIRRLQDEINRRASSAGGDGAPSTTALQTELAARREQQLAERPLVEQIIEGQIAYELQQVGLEFFDQTFPPVQFTFVEPPRKLVVSPRDRITTVYSQMLDAEMSLAEIKASEATYHDRYNVSAYITNIGGLGAYPTMVVDQASLGWILSTVAHEWTHNYLTLFPLGINYMTNPDLTTMNETVADIVGDEVGARAMQTFYHSQLLPPAGDDDTPAGQPPAVPSELPTFDFATEMRATRLRVDELLAAGQVTAAEAYMEQRRRVFVENGYPLRVLNQAYFAFHGSYGTSAASTSPLGPKLEQLRALSPDLRHFLQTVRTFTSVEQLDAALARAAAKTTPDSESN